MEDPIFMKGPRDPWGKSHSQERDPDLGPRVASLVKVRERVISDVQK